MMKKRIFKMSAQERRLHFCHFKAGDSPDMPTRNPLPPPTSSPTRETSRDVQQAKADEKQKEKKKKGWRSTFMNGKEGVSPLPEEKKSFLGGNG
jgi:hypothetical protein